MTAEDVENGKKGISCRQALERVMMHLRDERSWLTAHACICLLTLMQASPRACMQPLDGCAQSMHSPIVQS